jgi:uncharacterized protein YbaP (TraB family)
LRRALWPLLGALALSACGRPPVEAHPALFVVRDADTTIWLFGTIHLLPANVRWDEGPVDAALGQANMLVTEIPDGQLRGGADIFDAMAKAQGLPPALSRVPAERRAALAGAIKAAGLTPGEADALKTWALATTLGAADARAADADRSTGLEFALADRFRAAHKPQQGFESLKGQLALFDGLSETDQRALLVATLDDLADPKRGYRATLDAWRKGDMQGLADSLSPEFRNDPALVATLVTSRNRRWAAWIARRMDAPGKVLVAVGAGHLAGPDSLVAMLQAKGFAVRRVQ